MTTVKSFKYRLNPTAAQEQLFRQFAGCRRFVWNWALARKQETYQATGKRLTYTALASELVELKRQPETAFLQECHSQVLQQVLMDLERAFMNFFEKRAGFPRFKSKKRTSPTFRIPQHVTVIDNQVRLPKVGLVKATIHRSLEGVVTSATVKQDATGNWYVTFVSHLEQPENMVRTACTPVGIDVGLSSFVTLDDGTKVAAPRLYRRSERKLKRLQRQVSRCTKGSKSRNRARLALARQHQKVRNQRTDFLHKLSINLIRTFDALCIEDLNIKGLARSKLAKSFTDAGLGSFVRMLEYKAVWWSRQVVRVSRWFASSKTCFSCGAVHQLPLSERTWNCSRCGARHDRDMNAARNILREGLRVLAVGSTESQTAAGAHVRLATASSA
ncbi:MAG: IS200/IS605 family element transposase accessory protein TnpB [Herpetosiphonaceae bacterium]|nr:IS200/IS605 family element transposase accessory protein TnpB [Herpetosiphonaceae bacterium]